MLSKLSSSIFFNLFHDLFRTASRIHVSRWNQIPEHVCDPVPHFPHALANTTDSGMGSIVYIRCDSGYSLPNGDPGFQIQCDGRKWAVSALGGCERNELGNECALLITQRIIYLIRKHR